MARTTKRRYYKRRYYRRFRRYKAPTQYFKAKAEFVDKIQFPDGPGGAAYFVSRVAEPVVLNRSLLPNTAILEGYSYAVILAGLFSYYKITGIGIEVTPESRNSSIPAANVNPIVYISYRAGNSNSQVLQEVKSNNNTMILDPITRQKRYWRPGPYTDGDYFNTGGGAFAGAFTLLSDGNGVYAGQPSWQIRIIFYYLYKGSKA